MGLDCYLYRETYIEYDNYDVKTGEFNTPTVTLKYNVNKNKPLHNRKFKPVYIVEEIGYWRKANHIHRFFVDVLANGVDECQRINVTYENLLELKNICEEIVFKSKVDKKWGEFASKKLPTQSGFFFGGIEYDEYYLKDCEHLIKIVNELEKEKNNNFYTTFYYRASW